MTKPTKGFCLAATQPEIPPPAPAPERRYALRSYQLDARRRSLPMVLLNPLPQKPRD